MNEQYLIVLVIVGLALAYLGWRLLAAVRSLKGGGCGGGCGCASSKPTVPVVKLIAPEELTLRRR